MKYVVALVSAFAISTVLAVPVGPKADYTVVAGKVQELRLQVRTAMDNIKAIANDDNPSVGATISAALDAAAAEALAKLAEIQPKIDDETLTLAEAKETLEGLQTRLFEVVEELQPDLEQLSESAQEIISEEFLDALVRVDAICIDIYVALLGTARTRADFMPLLEKKSI